MSELLPSALDGSDSHIGSADVDVDAGYSDGVPTTIKGNYIDERWSSFGSLAGNFGSVLDNVLTKSDLVSIKGLDSSDPAKQRTAMLASGGVFALMVARLPRDKNRRAKQATIAALARRVRSDEQLLKRLAAVVNARRTPAVTRITRAAVGLVLYGISAGAGVAQTAGTQVQMDQGQSSASASTEPGSNALQRGTLPSVRLIEPEDTNRGAPSTVPPNTSNAGKPTPHVEADDQQISITGKHYKELLVGTKITLDSYKSTHGAIIRDGKFLGEVVIPKNGEPRYLDENHEIISRETFLALKQAPAISGERVEPRREAPALHGTLVHSDTANPVQASRPEADKMSSRSAELPASPTPIFSALTQNTQGMLLGLGVTAEKFEEEARGDYEFDKSDLKHIIGKERFKQLERENFKELLKLISDQLKAQKHAAEAVREGAVGESERRSFGDRRRGEPQPVRRGASHARDEFSAGPDASEIPASTQIDDILRANNVSRDDFNHYTGDGKLSREDWRTLLNAKDGQKLTAEQQQARAQLNNALEELGKDAKQSEPQSAKKIARALASSSEAGQTIAGIVAKYGIDQEELDHAATQGKQKVEKSEWKSITDGKGTESDRETLNKALEKQRNAGATVDRLDRVDEPGEAATAERSAAPVNEIGESAGRGTGQAARQEIADLAKKYDIAPEEIDSAVAQGKPKVEKPEWKAMTDDKGTESDRERLNKTLRDARDDETSSSKQAKSTREAAAAAAQESRLDTQNAEWHKKIDAGKAADKDRAADIERLVANRDLDAAGQAQLRADLSTLEVVEVGPKGKLQGLKARVTKDQAVKSLAGHRVMDGPLAGKLHAELKFFHHWDKLKHALGALNINERSFCEKVKDAADRDEVSYWDLRHISPELKGKAFHELTGEQQLKVARVLAAFTKCVQAGPREDFNLRELTDDLKVTRDEARSPVSGGSASETVISDVESAPKRIITRGSSGAPVLSPDEINAGIEQLSNLNNDGFIDEGIFQQGGKRLQLDHNVATGGRVSPKQVPAGSSTLVVEGHIQDQLVHLVNGDNERYHKLMGVSEAVGAAVVKARGPEAAPLEGSVAQLGISELYQAFKGDLYQLENLVKKQAPIQQLIETGAATKRGDLGKLKEAELLKLRGQLERNVTQEVTSSAELVDVLSANAALEQVDLELDVREEAKSLSRDAIDRLNTTYNLNLSAEEAALLEETIAETLVDRWAFGVVASTEGDVTASAQYDLIEVKGWTFKLGVQAGDISIHPIESLTGVSREFSLGEHDRVKVTAEAGISGLPGDPTPEIGGGIKIPLSKKGIWYFAGDVHLNHNAHVAVGLGRDAQKIYEADVAGYMAADAYGSLPADATLEQILAADADIERGGTGEIKAVADTLRANGLPLEVLRMAIENHYDDIRDAVMNEAIVQGKIPRFQEFGVSFGADGFGPYIKIKLFERVLTFTQQPDGNWVEEAEDRFRGASSDAFEDLGEEMYERLRALEGNTGEFEAADVSKLEKDDAMVTVRIPNVRLTYIGGEVRVVDPQGIEFDQSLDVNVAFGGANADLRELGLSLGSYDIATNTAELVFDDPMYSRGARVELTGDNTVRTEMNGNTIRMSVPLGESFQVQRAVEYEQSPDINGTKRIIHIAITTNPQPITATEIADGERIVITWDKDGEQRTLNQRTHDRDQGEQATPTPMGIREALEREHGVASWETSTRAEDERLRALISDKRESLKPIDPARAEALRTQVAVILSGTSRDAEQYRRLVTITSPGQIVDEQKIYAFLTDLAARNGVTNLTAAEANHLRGLSASWSLADITPVSKPHWSDAQRRALITGEGEIASDTSRDFVRLDPDSDQGDSVIAYLGEDLAGEVEVLFDQVREQVPELNGSEGTWWNELVATAKVIDPSQDTMVLTTSGRFQVVGMMPIPVESDEIMLAGRVEIDPVKHPELFKRVMTQTTSYEERVLRFAQMMVVEGESIPADLQSIYDDITSQMYAESFDDIVNSIVKGEVQKIGDEYVFEVRDSFGDVSVVYITMKLEAGIIIGHDGRSCGNFTLARKIGFRVDHYPLAELAVEADTGDSFVGHARQIEQEKEAWGVKVGLQFPTPERETFRKPGDPIDPPEIPDEPDKTNPGNDHDGDGDIDPTIEPPELP